MELTPEVIEKIKFLCKSYYYKFNIKEPFDDIFQEVIFRLLKTKYLDRYDSSKPLHNFLSGFIFNFFCKVYKKENYVVNKALSLDKNLGSSSSESYCLANFIPSSDVEEEDTQVLLETIMTRLESIFPFSSFVVYNEELFYVGAYKKPFYEKFFNTENIIFTRSHATVFNFLYLGMSQVEIKDFLKVSKSWVSKIVTSISELKEVRELAQIYGFQFH